MDPELILHLAKEDLTGKEDIVIITRNFRNMKEPLRTYFSCETTSEAIIILSKALLQLLQES